MVQNIIQLETSLFYLFSNNHVNELIECDFDFDDEEVMAYYISLLKTILLKLNPATVQFFFDYGGWRPGRKQEVLGGAGCQTRFVSPIHESRRFRGAPGEYGQGRGEDRRVECVRSARQGAKVYFC